MTSYYVTVPGIFLEVGNIYSYLLHYYVIYICITKKMTKPLCGLILHVWGEYKISLAAQGCR